MKSYLCALALLTTMAPVLAQDAATAPVAATPTVAKSTVTDEGLIITPLDVPTDIAAKMLGIQTWRFKVIVPNDGLRLSTSLQMRQSGKKWPLNGVEISGAPQEFEYTLGLMPLETEFLMKAEKLRVYQEMRVLKESSLPTGSRGSLSTLPNPWLELQTSIIPYFAYPGNIQKDGGIELMRFNVKDLSYTESPSLFLVLTTKPDPEDVAIDEPKNDN